MTKLLNNESMRDIEREGANTTKSDTFNPVILQALDMPFDGKSPELLLHVHLRNNFKDALNNLPPLASGMVRIFDVSPRAYRPVNEKDSKEWRGV